MESFTRRTMKTIMIIFVAALLTGCSTYKVKLGKKCTPHSSEWSYVWFVEKGSDDNVRKSNCT